MPLRNAGRFLDAAIASIVDQAFQDWELILIDDASTDGSTVAMSQWCRCDQRIRMTTNKSCRGLVASLNAGVSLAQADLIARMDGDDISRAERLGAQFGAFGESANLVLCGTAADIIDPDGRILRVFRPPTDDGSIRRFLLKDNPFVHSSVMFRANAFRAVGGYSPRFLHEDYELWVRIARLGELRNLPQVFVQHREHPASLSADLGAIETRVQRLRIQARAAMSFLLARRG